MKVLVESVIGNLNPFVPVLNDYGFIPIKEDYSDGVIDLHTLDDVFELSEKLRLLNTIKIKTIFEVDRKTKRPLLTIYDG